LTVLLCAGLCLLLGLLEKPAQSPRAARKIRTVPASFDFTQYRIPVAAEAEPGRAIYPYSVIPGGVRDREELAEAADRDPVVGAHYANFRIDRAHVVRVPHPQFVYVSYRIQNKIFWSSRKVLLAQGEKLISDGQNLARTRCGNQVSAVPQEPVSAEEPAPEVFDTPFIPVDDQPLLSETIGATPFPLTDEVRLPLLESLINPPDLISLENRYFDDVIVPYVPTPYFPPTYVLPPGGEVTPYNSAVPEPGTLILLASGLAVPLLLKWRSRISSRSKN
jgi:hypothetical protein